MFYVYIMASMKNGTLYIGHTDNLNRRVFEHRNGLIPGFTKKYGCRRLVWCEGHDSREGAKVREKRLKNWRRQWKIELIEADNPGWSDLSEREFPIGRRHYRVGYDQLARSRHGP